MEVSCQLHNPAGFTTE